MTSGIYQIENQINGKRYVGSAMNLRKRWQAHLSALRRSVHHNPHLQAAFRKHGEAAFMFATLESVGPHGLIGREQHYLETLNPEYNICPTAGSSLGRPCSRETRQKMSKALTGKGHPNYGKHHSEETRAKMSVAHKGRPKSEETRRKLSLALKGKPLSAETRIRMSEAHKGVPLTEEHKQKISASWTPERREALGVAMRGGRNRRRRR